MNESKNVAKVIAVLEPGNLEDQITQTLDRQDEFDLVATENGAENLAHVVSETRPEIILLDYKISQKQDHDLVDELSLKFPSCAVIAILPEDNPALLQQVTLSGAQAFIVQPFTHINLVSTLRRVRELRSRQLKGAADDQSVGADLADSLHTVVFFSPRGGVGCTTLAINYALTLVAQSGREVLLMEGKEYFGHLDVMLNLRARNTIADLLPHVANLDRDLIRDVVTRHTSGLNLLLGASSYSVSQGIRAEDLFAIVKRLQREYEYLVIDAGNSINENVVTLMDSAFRIVVVINPDLASLQDVRKFYEISKSLGYADNKIQVVLNRQDMKGGVATEQIAQALPTELFATIPEDKRALTSLNQGVPLQVNNPKSPIVKSVDEMVKSLTSQADKELNKLMEQHGRSDSSEDNTLLKSSRLG